MLSLRSFLVVSFCLLAHAVKAQDQRHLEAGAATVNITPPLGELIVGGFDPLPADDVHDELHARAIVLTERLDAPSNAIGAGKDLDPNRTLAIVVCDNVGISREVFDAAKSVIQKKLVYCPATC